MRCKPIRQTFVALACVLFFTLQTNAQQGHRFADTSAVWQIVETQYPMYPPLIISVTTKTYSVAGDTVLLGKAYQIIERGGRQHFVRQDSGRVFYYNYSNEDMLLYDFTLNAGDSLPVPYHPFDTVYLHVDSVDTVDFGGLKKRMFVRCDNCIQYLDEVWVEGIGRIGETMFWPFDRELIADGPSHELLCYEEDGQVVYPSLNHQDCHDDTLIYLTDKNILEEQVSIYPNPVSDFLFIDLPQQEAVDVCLTSVLGEELLCEKHWGNTTIDMRGYPESIYLLQITSAKGSVSKKIILER